MKVEKKKPVEYNLTYEELIPGHLYIEEDNPDDLLLKLDDGIAEPETGEFYADNDAWQWAKTGRYREVGGKIVIED